MLPQPLFDSMDHLAKNAEAAILPDEKYRSDFSRTLLFLRSYTGSQGTFNSYRREVERLLQWTWLIRKKTIPTLKREDIEDFIRFCQNPPSSWIGIKKVPRFVLESGIRKPNPAWRPFVATLSKMAHQDGYKPEIEQFSLAHGSTQEIFAILSSYYNFLIAEEYVHANPVALIRQKSKFVRKSQQTAPIRRLSAQQWETVMEAAEEMASENPEMHERTRFMLSLLFGLYLRISELAASERWIPMMNDFAKDSNDSWWFTTVGKGNKERQVAVSNEVLKSLIRWRTFLGLSSLPNPSDNMPLLPRMRGNGPMSDTAPIRRLIQQCFDRGVQKLRQANQLEEADHLRAATVHWLRHTGISEDVKERPREHVRDDAGHSSSVTTDRYIDVEKAARHKSARDKKLIFPK